MKKLLLGILFFWALQGKSQELYAYTDAASNMPVRSASFGITANFLKPQNAGNRFSQRYTPQLMLEAGKRIMFATGFTMSDMHTASFRYESAFLYTRYRFLSIDDVHSHFRMALFAKASKTQAPYQYNEVNLSGDKSGIAVGLIATRLLNRVAFSAAISQTQALDPSRNDHISYIPGRNYQSIDYSFSSGYLLLPHTYTSYHQTNINLYAELLAQQSLDIPAHYIDLGTALQFIFNSNAKLDIGYRFQLNGNMLRMSQTGWLLSFERTFLNAWKAKPGKRHTLP